MSYQTFYIAFLVGLATACTKDATVASAVDPIIAQRSAANLILQNFEPGAMESYITKDYVDHQAADRDLRLRIAYGLNHSAYKISLDTTHQYVVAYCALHSVNPLRFDAIRASSLQYAALEAGHRAAFREPRSAHRDSLIAHYLAVVIAQQGIDVDAMAEMLVEVKNQLDPSSHKTFEDYIAELAHSDIARTYPVIEKAWKREQAGETLDEMSDPINELEMQHTISVYQAGEKALELLGKKS